ncbi:MAG: integrase [Ectothiorhodospiraceae bacterium]|nr:integrase [Ectothiorhodospiraceae bacterium]
MRLQPAFHNPNHYPHHTQANTDEQVIGLWLFGKAHSTQKAYRREISSFLDFCEDKPLTEITLSMLQQYALSIQQNAPASQARSLSAIKSLYSFARKIGYLTFNPAAVLKLPKYGSTVSNRILSESDVQRLIIAASGRNEAIIRLLYGSGIRVSELVALSWRDVHKRNDQEGVLTISGKGGKVRSVVVYGNTWKTVCALKPGEVEDSTPVFVSRKRAGRLSATQVYRIVRTVARKAGISADVSPHWLRHCHATHALERGGKIHEVQTTLGHSSVAVTSKYLHARPELSSGKYLID